MSNRRRRRSQGSAGPGGNSRGCNGVGVPVVLSKVTSLSQGSNSRGLNEVGG